MGLPQIAAALMSYFFHSFCLCHLGKDAAKQLNITLKFYYLHELSFGLFFCRFCHIMAYACQLKNNLNQLIVCLIQIFLLANFFFFFLNLENIYNIYKGVSFISPFQRRWDTLFYTNFNPITLQVQSINSDVHFILVSYCKWITLCYGYW